MLVLAGGGSGSGSEPVLVLSPPPAASYLFPSFQGLLSDNDTVRLGLDFQRMLRINHMLYIAARWVDTHSAPPP